MPAEVMPAEVMPAEVMPAEGDPGWGRPWLGVPAGTAVTAVLPRRAFGADRPPLARRIGCCGTLKLPAC